MRIVQASYFLKHGYDVDIVLAWQDGPVPSSVPKNARIIVFGLSRLKQFAKPFREYLKAEKPDVVLSDMWPLTIWSVLAHRFSRAKSRIIVCDHNPLSTQYADRGLAHKLFLKASIAFTYRLASTRIGVSNGVANDVSKLSSISRKDFEVIYNPLTLNAETESKETVGAGLVPNYSGNLILAVGKFKAQKNYPLLIRSFAKLLRKQEAHLLILGVGHLYESVMALVQSLGLEKHVSMPGFVESPRQYFQKADIFVLSSDYEGFGNVIVEALSCGTPVVSTDCPSGPAEILENGRYGTLVPCNDEDALAEAMLKSLNSSHDKEALKRRAADFSLEKISDQYLQIMFPS